jgi:hypothetical protein
VIRRNFRQPQGADPGRLQGVHRSAELIRDPAWAEADADSDVHSAIRPHSAGPHSVRGGAVPRAGRGAARADAIDAVDAVRLRLIVDRARSVEPSAVTANVCPVSSAAYAAVGRRDIRLRGQLERDGPVSNRRRSGCAACPPGTQVPVGPVGYADVPGTIRCLPCSNEVTGRALHHIEARVVEQESKVGKAAPTV